MSPDLTALCCKFMSAPPLDDWDFVISPPSFKDIQVDIQEIASRVPGGLLTVWGAVAATLAGFLLGLLIYDEDEQNNLEVLGVGTLAGGVVGAGIAALFSIWVPGIGGGPAAVFGALGGVLGGILGASLVVLFAEGPWPLG